jgi:acetyltransferase-like isoleucine patch superfamily enzyme
VPPGKLAVGAPARAIRESPQRRRKRMQEGDEKGQSRTERED